MESSSDDEQEWMGDPLGTTYYNNNNLETDSSVYLRHDGESTSSKANLGHCSPVGEDLDKSESDVPESSHTTRIPFTQPVTAFTHKRRRSRKVGDKDMFRRIESRVTELDNVISSFQRFMQHQELYAYFSGIVDQFCDLSTQMKTKMGDISSLTLFLNTHHLSASNTCAGYFSVLPEELCLHILSFLDWTDLIQISLLNRQWKSLARDNMVWKLMCYRNWKGMEGSDSLTQRFTHTYSHSEGGEAEETTEHTMCGDLEKKPAQTVIVEEQEEQEEQGPQETQEEQEEHDGGRTARAKRAPAPLSARSKKRYKTSWRDVFMKRLRVDENWKTGHYTASQVVPCIAMSITGMPADNGSAAFCLQFDDEYLVTATDIIQVLDVNTGEYVRAMQGHTDSVMCLDFDKQHIVSGSKDNHIRIWDIKTAECTKVLAGHDNGVRTLRFDGKHIVSGARDSTIRVWDMESGDLQSTLRGHHYTVYCLEFDRRHIISGSVDKTIRLWDRESGHEVRAMKGHVNSIRCLKFNQTTIVSGAWDNKVMVWDFETGKNIQKCEGHIDRVMCLQFDDRKIVSGSVDRTVKIWDLRTPGVIHTLAGHDYTVYHLYFDDYKIGS
eukprot:TRINITY_DN4162_c0_g2_i3.p1 TRINITY_DN4162_c0_g2~~TRINITY_DN4162_c0_g2_i3.p1  ORF type:complete len:608 (-),score=88.06 TRINITY_DN4162_c0_g2_i3:84-1907(-)